MVDVTVDITVWSYPTLGMVVGVIDAGTGDPSVITKSYGP